MVEQQLNFEGLFETVLYARPRKSKETKEMEYGFETKTDGTTPTKTPKGMFVESFIPNDLLFVKNAIHKYEN